MMRPIKIDLRKDDEIYLGSKYISNGHWCLLRICVTPQLPAKVEGPFHRGETGKYSNYTFVKMPDSDLPNFEKYFEPEAPAWRINDDIGLFETVKSKTLFHNILVCFAGGVISFVDKKYVDLFREQCTFVGKPEAGAALTLLSGDEPVGMLAPCQANSIRLDDIMADLGYYPRPVEEIDPFAED